MRRKIGLVLGPRLIRRAMGHAAQCGVSFNTMVEEALRAWLDRAGTDRTAPSLVAQTAGNLSLDSGRLARLLAEDLYDAA